MSQKPAKVQFVTGETIRYQHVDPKDGYLFVRDGDHIRYFPWHRIHGVFRNMQAETKGDIESTEYQPMLHESADDTNDGITEATDGGMIIE